MVETRQARQKRLERGAQPVAEQQQNLPTLKHSRRFTENQNSERSNQEPVPVHPAAKKIRQESRFMEKLDLLDSSSKLLERFVERQNHSQRGGKVTMEEDSAESSNGNPQHNQTNENDGMPNEDQRRPKPGNCSTIETVEMEEEPNLEENAGEEEAEENGASDEEDAAHEQHEADDEYEGDDENEEEFERRQEEADKELEIAMRSGNYEEADTLILEGANFCRAVQVLQDHCGIVKYVLPHTYDAASDAISWERGKIEGYACLAPRISSEDFSTIRFFYLKTICKWKFSTKQAENDWALSIYIINQKRDSRLEVEVLSNYDLKDRTILINGIPMARVRFWHQATLKPGQIYTFSFELIHFRNKLIAVQFLRLPK